MNQPTSELRLVLTTDDYDATEAFFRDVLGLSAWDRFPSPGRVVLFDVGRATIELADERHAAHVDEHEVGHRRAGPVRVAFRVPDVVRATETAEGNAAAELVAGPTITPWGSVSARFDGPESVQITLFSDGD